jgi:hypothetical protein
MSKRYPGGIITKNPATPTGPYNTGAAPGIWTLEQQMQFKQQGVWPTAGLLPNYIEDVFSTYLYTGTGASQTVTNNINLSANGGLIWFKPRDTGNNHNLIDSARGIDKFLISNATNAQGTASAGYGVTSFNTTGFTLGSPWTSSTNTTSTNYVSWTFREQAKFFDIVTYTGNGTAGRTISHNLGSVPGCIIVKQTDVGNNWAVYHRSIGNASTLYLQATDAAGASAFWNSTTPTSSVFTVGSSDVVNGNGNTYVAYIFAHDAGGFGPTGTDNVISCGSYVGNGSSASQTINLGYEPQWVMVKASSSGGVNFDWIINDNMRGLFTPSVAGQTLFPNSTSTEFSQSTVSILSNGFTPIGSSSNSNQSGVTYIYMAIRKGPMAVPTDATKVFSPNVPTAFTQFTTGFPVDLGMWNYKPGYAENTVVNDRLRGVSTTNTTAFANNLVTSTTAGEAASQSTQNWNNTGLYAVTSQAVFYSFRRAPSFFDEVCYTGTGSNLTLPHNLTVAPELIIAKVRSTSSSWGVSTSTDWTKYLLLNSTNAQASASLFGTPDATNFYPTASGGFSGAGNTYVAYLFATCAGVSKVGTYTGTGTTQVINCGFTAGSRFIMIKRTDSTGDWYFWDSARGIVAGNDPYSLFNTSAAEVTGTDYVDTAATGFEISSTAPAGINANGGSYIFLAIA